MHIIDLQKFDNGYLKIVLSNKECYYFRNVSIFNQVLHALIQYQYSSEERFRRQFLLYADFAISLLNNTVLKNRSFDIQDLFDSEIKKLN